MSSSAGSPLMVILEKVIFVRIVKVYDLFEVFLSESHWRSLRIIRNKYWAYKLCKYRLWNSLNDSPGQKAL